VEWLRFYWLGISAASKLFNYLALRLVFFLKCPVSHSTRMRIKRNWSSKQSWAYARDFECVPGMFKTSPCGIFSDCIRYPARLTSCAYVGLSCASSSVVVIGVNLMAAF
jgi:hypothetical protein